MKIAILNIDWARKKGTSKTSEFLDQFDFDFLILTEAVDLDLKNFPYKYLCTQIPENIIYENLNYTEYLKGKKAFRTILYSKISHSKRYQVTDDKTNLALEFETEFGNIIFYCTIIGTWFNRKPFVDNELQNTIQDCNRLHSINRNLFIAGDFNTSFKTSEEKFSINSETTKTLIDFFEDLNLINATKEIDENIDHIVIPKTFMNKLITSEAFVDKNILSDHKGIYISMSS